MFVVEIIPLYQALRFPPQLLYLAVTWPNKLLLRLIKTFIPRKMINIQVKLNLLSTFHILCRNNVIISI